MVKFVFSNNCASWTAFDSCLLDENENLRSKRIGKDCNQNDNIYIIHIYIYNYISNFRRILEREL